MEGQVGGPLEWTAGGIDDGQRARSQRPHSAEHRHHLRRATRLADGDNQVAAKVDPAVIEGLDAGCRQPGRAVRSHLEEVAAVERCVVG